MTHTHIKKRQCPWPVATHEFPMKSPCLRRGWEKWTAWSFWSWILQVRTSPIVNTTWQRCVLLTRWKLFANYTSIMGSTSFSEFCNGLVMDCKLSPNRYREACSLSRHDMGLGREGQPRTAKDTTAGCKTVSKILVAWLNFGCCVSCFIFWLVVGTFLCFHILGIILPTDYFFSKELKTPTSICLCRMLNIYTHILLLMLSKVFFMFNDGNVRNKKHQKQKVGSMSLFFHPCTESS